MVRNRSVSFFLAVICSIFVCQGSQGQGAAHLLINEISPFVELESETENQSGPWIELVNPSESTISLSGWTVSFLSGWSLELTSETECLPGSLILITTGTLPEGIDPDSKVIVLDGGPEAWLIG